MRSKLSLLSAAVLLSAHHQADARCDFGVDTCKIGFVWRDAFDGDHVCVDGASRSQAVADNRAAPSRRTNGPFPGPQPCVQGFVWREASAADHVCVTGTVRAKTRLENTQAASRRDPQCAVPPALLGTRMEWERPVVGTAPPKPSTQQIRIGADGSLTGVSQSPLSSVPDRMWNPGQTLKVLMRGGGAIVRSKVRRAAEQWSKHANIRFQFVDTLPAEIRADFNPGGSWSTIGRDALLVPFGFQTMNFGWLTDSTDDAEINRVVLHEFGHALGLIHEHQSPTAGIPWDRDKVYQYFFTSQNPPWTQADVDRNIFERYSVNVTNYSQYDPDSIMHYGYPAELTLNGVAGKRNSFLSPTDIAYIKRWYPYAEADQGVLRTNDDCDEINFKVSYGTEAPGTVRIRLEPGPTVTWWKLLEIPVDGGGKYQGLQINANSGDPRLPSGQTFDVARLDSSRPIRFNKAKFLGDHTRLDYTWDVMQALKSGSKVELSWSKDRCH